MKLKYSLFSRRKFLNSFLAGGTVVFLSSFLYPIIIFLFPPEREPDQIILKYANYNDMSPYTARMFAWGNKPGILVKKASDYHAFIAVCTHLDCTVSFLAERRMFYCACHKGWFDEDGVNVAGPPPSPLKQLNVELDGENLVIHKKGERAVS
ncbi:MAG: ubiquinol-cytochrome c reductase iron-sulfur subunit [Candidatus Aminicenantaceae bacterium]